MGQTGGGGVAGVYGHGRFSQFGVLGTAFGQSIGVVGASVINTNDLMNLNVPPANVSLDSLGAGSGIGVFGKSGSGIGVRGGTAFGSDTCRAASFRGPVDLGGHVDVFGFTVVTGNTQFKIDHPLDP